MQSVILLLAASAPPTFEVENKCPPRFEVVAAKHCPCSGYQCRCNHDVPCACGDGCKCRDCPTAYAAGYERVKKGETLRLAVGVKAKKGEYQSPPIPNVKPGVYRWYRGPDGQPTCDFLFVPTPTERNESYRNGDGIPNIPGPFFLPPTNSPFTLPGCLPGKA